MHRSESTPAPWRSTRGSSCFVGAAMMISQIKGYWIFTRHLGHLRCRRYRRVFRWKISEEKRASWVKLKSICCFSFHGDQFCGVFRRSAPGSFRLRRGWIERAVVCRLRALRGSGRVWINRRSSLINTSSRCRRIYTVVKITTRVLSCTSKSQPCFKTILSPRMFSRLFSLSTWWRRRGDTAFAGKSSAVLFAGYNEKLDKCCYHCNLCATRFPPVPMPIGENPWWGKKLVSSWSHFRNPCSPAFTLNES